jgi:hypothetical protein
MSMTFVRKGFAPDRGVNVGYEAAAFKLGCKPTDPGVVPYREGRAAVWS